MSGPLIAKLAALALTLPLVLALASYTDAGATARNLALGALVAAWFFGAQFAAYRLTRLDNGSRLVAVFAGLYLALQLTVVVSGETYRLGRALTDLGLLYLVFFAAAAAAPVGALCVRAVLALLVPAFGLAVVVPAIHQHIFGSPIGAEGYRAMLQSSAAEALEFTRHFLDAPALAVALASFAASVGAAIFARPVVLSRDAFGLGGLFALAATAVLASNPGPLAARLQGVTEGFQYVAEVMEYRALRQTRNASPPALALTQTAPLAGEAQTYVFIIGESLTRNHMSLYGYWRDTTPALEAVASEMAVFSDVVSPHSHTEESLELVLTLASQANGLRFADASNYSLIEMLRAAGFATWWISNHNSFGPWDNKVAVLAGGADHVRFSGARSGRLVSGPPDEVLLEPLAGALRDPAPRKAIFLHMLGNHWEYAKRYPPQEAVFRLPPDMAEIGASRHSHPRLQLVNEYDNAVRYHDRLAAQVIGMLRATGRAGAVVLFADHGENVYELKNHQWQQFTRDHVEVPFVMWFSPQYQSLMGQTARLAYANAGRPFALEDLPHLVADLAGLRGDVFDPRRSPLSADYRPPLARPIFARKRVYEEADERHLSVRRALRRITSSHPELQGAIWAHRVNTLGKMMEAAQLFAGAEIDVVYDAAADALLVNHPPDPASGLRLDVLLAYANRLNPKLSLWLDLKNLNEANVARVVQKLKALDERHAIRARALAETDHTGPAAAALRDAGFVSSYYLPTKTVLQRADPGAPASGGCAGAAEIRRTLESRRFAAASYDWRGRRWVERCLGSFLRQRGLRSYAWDLGPVLSDPRAHEALDDQRLREYAALSAVLLPFRSLFDDWR